MGQDGRHAAVRRDLRGQLDNITSLGYIEGWAYDAADPTKAIDVCVMAGEHEIAWGLAHRFRADLMDAGCGTGWCAFRVRIGEQYKDQLSGPMRLLHRSSGQVLHAVDSMSSIADPEEPIASVEARTACDPTLISGIWQLRGCEQILLRYIRKHGVEAYVRAAYIYVLGRHADEGGRAQYARCIRQATLTPVGVLEVLADSDEYRSRPRQLGTPNSPTFPFL